MHIILIISSLRVGGAERVLSDLANYWAAKGHKISIITWASSDERPFYPLCPQIQLFHLDQLRPKASFFKRLIYAFRRLLSLRQALTRLNPKVVISFMDRTNITTLLAIKGLRAATIVSERTYPSCFPLPFIFQLLRKWLYPKAFRLVVLTEATARFFHKIPSITIIPNGVYCPLQKKVASLGPIKNILSVGRLHPIKGFDVLIRAFSLLLTKYPDLRLTIYGEGPERPHLEQLIFSLGLSSNISLPGLVKDITHKLLEGDLFIFPSRGEGFPNALCEAMAVGLPVIASDCPGCRDIVQDRFNGRLFPTGNASSLTKVMDELIQDDEQRNRLAHQAKEICNTFHPNKILALWDHLIDQAQGCYD